MATPDPEGIGLLTKVLAAATAVIVPLGTIYKLGQSALAKKADKSELEDVKAEVEQRRRIDEKLFDKLEEHSRRDEDLFRELTGTIGRYHAEVMAKLGDKADR